MEKTLDGWISGFIVEDKVSAENIGFVTIDNIFFTSQMMITIVMILIIVLQLNFNQKYCHDINRQDYYILK